MASFLMTIFVLTLMDVTLAQTTYPLRLVEGSSNYGRLEIQYDGQWGTICDDSFGINDARVACRQLGLDTAVVDFYPEARFGEGVGQVWLDEVACGGSESLLADCQHDGFGIENCDHNEDVGVSCGIDSRNLTTLRLVGGSSNYGRLEILYNGQWGTICDDSFGINDARVACRQLGLDTITVDYYHGAHFGEGSGVTWLDNLLCTGSELSLASCSHRGFGIEDCSHSEDVGVSCGVENVNRTTRSSGSINFGWTTIIVVIVVISVITSIAVRRRRIYLARQRQTTTTVIQPPSTTVVTVPPASQGTQPLPTYHHGAQPPPPGAPTQPYPPASAGGYAYPPQAPPGQQNPAPYPVQTYPTAPNSQTNPAAYPPAPAQYAGPPPGAAYPPPQTGNFQSPPTYPAYGAASVSPNVPGQEQNLPPPPNYDDVVKQ